MSELAYAVEAQECGMLTVSGGAAQAQSTTRSFYDSRGSFCRQLGDAGKWTNFSDGQGRFSGSSIRHGKWTNFYDRQGRYGGSVIDTSSR